MSELTSNFPMIYFSLTKVHYLFTDIKFSRHYGRVKVTDNWSEKFIIQKKINYIIQF